MPRAADAAPPCASKEAQVVVAHRLAAAEAAEVVEHSQGGGVGQEEHVDDGVMAAHDLGRALLLEEGLKLPLLLQLILIQ